MGGKEVAVAMAVLEELVVGAAVKVEIVVRTGAGALALERVDGVVASARLGTLAATWRCLLRL